jgi:chemotaxis protein MotB
MARRRKNHEEPENLERWLVSYADFITLLFAFFVVMYAVSSVNEGKYRVLSEALNTVFLATPSSDDPIQIGEPPRDLLALPDGPLVPQPNQAGAEGEALGAAEGESGAVQGTDQGEGAGERFREDGAATRVADELMISLQDYIDQDLLKVTQAGDRIEIEMRAKMLFASGTAHLTRPSLQALREMSKTLKRVSSHLQVEGHTDNVPIATPAFPSNWELSAARAASVVHFLGRQGVEPWRMAAVGLGEHRPIAENTDEEGRAANRRVTIVVLTGQRSPDAQIESDGEVPWAEGPGVQL